MTFASFSLADRFDSSRFLGPAGGFGGLVAGGLGATEAPLASCRAPPRRRTGSQGMTTQDTTGPRLSFRVLFARKTISGRTAGTFWLMCVLFRLLAL